MEESPTVLNFVLCSLWQHNSCVFSCLEEWHFGGTHCSALDFFYHVDPQSSSAEELESHQQFPWLSES